MHTGKHPPFTLKDLATLRQLIITSRANNDSYSWIRLVDTQSMSPSFDGDIDLLVEWTRPYTFNNGDLIVISKSDLPFLLVHRACEYQTTNHGQQVLQIADQFVFGDEVSVGWVDIEAVLGKVIQISYGRKTRIAMLNSASIQRLAFQIAKLSLRRYKLLTNETNAQNLNNRFAMQFVTAQHRLFCYLFRITLFLNAYLTYKTKQSSKSIT
jgi:hypothetical protein